MSSNLNSRTNHWTIVSSPDSNRKTRSLWIFLRSNSLFRLFLCQTNVCHTVQCGIRCRFHQQKECDNFCCLIFALQTTLIAWLAVCVSIVSMFCIFHIFHIGRRRGVLRVTMFFPKGVQLQLDGWPWNGEGALGALRCMGTQCWVEL